jgi:hypothetical protein
MLHCSRGELINFFFPLLLTSQLSPRDNRKAQMGGQNKHKIGNESSDDEEQSVGGSSSIVLQASYLFSEKQSQF